LETEKERIVVMEAVNIKDKEAKTNSLAKKRVHRKLGYDNEEKKAIVMALNKLLANYSVHYQKLRNFHWNVKGPDFFDLHEQFEKRYRVVYSQIDEIAERIKVFGASPLSTMRDYISNAELIEQTESLSAGKMVEEVLNDYEILLKYLTDAVNQAIDIGDVGTEDMLNSYINDIEKQHWMLHSFSQN